MDRAQFEIIGNVGKIEIKPLKEDKKLAILSVATTERWRPESKDPIEKTHWHRIAVFAPGKVALIQTAVQVGARVRLVGQIRPSSWEDDRGMTKYGIEFVVTALGDVEILARGKPRAEDASKPEGEAGDKSAKGTKNKAA